VREKSQYPYLAVSENGEQKGKALVDKLLRVVVGPHLQEVLQQLVDDALEPQFVGTAERQHPAVQRPRHADVAQVQSQF